MASEHTEVYLRCDIIPKAHVVVCLLDELHDHYGVSGARVAKISFYLDRYAYSCAVGETKAKRECRSV